MNLNKISKYLLISALPVVAGMLALGEQTRAQTAAAEMHHIALKRDGTLWHTIRHQSGGWEPYTQLLPKPPSLVQWAPMAGVGRDMHVLAATTGSIHHTIRYANGSWPTGLWGDASSVLGVTHLWDLAAAELNGDLQVCAADSIPGGVVFKHGGRFSSNGNWIPLTERGTRNYNQARVVDCAAVGSNFHAVLVDSAGSLFHAMRTPDGNWNGFNFLDGPNGWTSSKVAIAKSWGGLHVVVVSGNLVHHRIRYEDGTWSAWGAISGTSGVQSIDAASVMDDLHVVVGIDRNQFPSTGVLHIVRYQNGSWSALGDVTNHVTNGSQTRPLEKAAASGALL